MIGRRVGRRFQRTSDNYIDDTEIDVQRRIVGGWEASLNHREFIGQATLDGTLSYRRGTGAFGSIEATEDPFGERRGMASGREGPYPIAGKK